MKNWTKAAFVALLVLLPLTAQAEPVENVEVCSIYSPRVCTGPPPPNMVSEAGGDIPNSWGCPGLQNCTNRCYTTWSNCTPGEVSGYGQNPVCDAKLDACIILCRETECFPVY